MTTIMLTKESIAQDLANNHAEYVASYMNARAARLYVASYSSGAYGRIMLPLLKHFYPRVNWSGQSTWVALAVQDAMESIGYRFNFQGGVATFEKTGLAA